MRVKKIIISIAKKNVILRKILRKISKYKSNLLLIFNRFLNVENNVIIFESYLGRSYACSPRAIYEEILKDDFFKDFKLYWAFRDVSKKEYLNEKTNVVKYRSREYYKIMATAKYIVTNSRLREEISPKKDQIYLQCWHGTPLKRLGHDIIDNTKSALNSKKEIEKKYDNEESKLDYFISPSAFATEKFMTAFRITDKNKMLEFGYPRNDYLYNFTKKDIKIIKEKMELPLGKKVILYAPTFRDDQHESGFGYTYNLELEFDKMAAELSDEYIILFRAHYLVASNFNFEKYNGFIIDVSKIDDINDLYVISDILITDYSSVFFDFANLRRPIIFYMYDLDRYENELRGFYLDLEELPGRIINQVDDLVDYIVKNDYKNEFSEKLDVFNKKFNYLEDGNASKRIIAEVFKR